MTVWNKYEPTAARRHGRPGREIRPQSVTIDIHSHVAVPAAGAYVAQQNASISPGLHSFQSPETAAVNAKQDEDLAADELAIDEDEEPSADEEVDLATGDEDLGVATGDEDEEG